MALASSHWEFEALVFEIIFFEISVFEISVGFEFRTVVIGEHVCAGGSGDCLAQILARSNDGFAAALAQKALHGFDFGAHVSGREMASPCELV